MRRVITTLAILLVVVVAGMTALVLLVNPNDFRAYMVQQVEQRSGYQLDVQGDLRWHVWPKLSILAGRMSLKAPGAAQPMVAAENMRLDVDLWPLLSHQLSVSQVMLKNAVIRATPDSTPQQPKNAPVAPGHGESVAAPQGWSFNISQLRIDDSLFIWQQAGGDELNFRHFNLNLDQDEHKQANIELSTSVTRNQRNATISLKGALDAAQYPHALTGKIEALDYSLSGANIPAQGIKGQLSAQGSWNGDKQQFALAQMKLTANDSTLSGDASGQIALPQTFALSLHADRLNLDNLMMTLSQNNDSGTQHATVARAPVIAEPRTTSNADSPFNGMDVNLRLHADNAVWRELKLQDLQLAASNQQGVMKFSTLSGKLDAGTFSLPGEIDISQPVTHVRFQPVLENVAIQPLLKAFDLPQTLQGAVSLSGDIGGDGITVEEAKRHWQGRAQVSAANLKLAQLDVQQMVRRAVARISNRVSNEESQDQGIHHLGGSMMLNHGVLHFTDLKGNGDRLNLTGGGDIDLVKKQLDVTFGLKISGWQGDDKLVSALSQQVIPFRMYGDWQQVQYSLPVDQVLRQQLQNEAKSRLNNWLDRQPSESDGDNNKEKPLRP